MPIMVVCRCDIGPSSTGQSSEDTGAKNELGKDSIRMGSHGIVKNDEGETRAYGNASVGTTRDAGMTYQMLWL